MCRCKAPITDNECKYLRKLHKDPRTFIYHVSRMDGKLLTALVPKGINPNEIALKRGFLDDKGELEWFNTIEHDCINES